MAHDVFISHSSINKTTADAICHALEQNGIRCWIAPRDVPVGSQYGEEIIKGIEGCQVFLLVFSDEINYSPAVQNELERAVVGYKKIVVPCRIEDVPMNKNIEFFLAGTHWINAYPDDTVFSDLVTGVSRLLGKGDNVKIADELGLRIDDASKTGDYGTNGTNENSYANFYERIKYHLSKQDSNESSKDCEIDEDDNIYKKIAISAVTQQATSTSIDKLVENYSGRLLKWVDQENWHTKIFQIDKIIDPQKGVFSFESKVLDSKVLFENPDRSVTRQFSCEPIGFTGSSALIVTFDHNLRTTYVYAGVLQPNKITVIKNPDVMRRPAPSAKAEHAKKLGLIDELEYAVEMDEHVTLIDPETGIVTVPEIYYDEASDEIKSRISATRYSSLFAFSITNKNKEALKATDFDIGSAYFYGDYGLERNYQKAFFYLRKAANTGDEQAQYMLSKMYFEGRGVQKNTEIAVEWIKKSLEQNYKEAYYMLGYIAEKENSDYVEAIRNYKHAAELGSPYAQTRLGWLYEKGIGIAADAGIASDYYQKAIEQDFANEQYYIGCKLEHKHENDAAEFFENAAILGHMYAQCKLGDIYRNGTGRIRDYDKAFEYYSLSEKQGCIYAAYGLGLLYNNGRGCEKNEKKAFEYYQKAAIGGYSTAQNRLGNMLCDGIGCIRDYNKAFEYFSLAEQQGHASATNNLGWMYEHGHGCEKDYEKAFSQYSKAVERGGKKNTKANLGYLLLNGFGCEPNYDAAFDLITEAANDNSPKAHKYLGEIYEYGKGRDVDLCKALEFYQKAKELGQKDVDYKIKDLSEK